MAHFLARTVLWLATPVLAVVYWRNNLKSLEINEVWRLVSYNELGSFFPDV